MKKPYNYRVSTLRPRKADKGHSIVKMESWTKDAYGFGQRRALTCQCGKRMTGNGERSHYAHTAHLKQEGVQPC